MLGDRAVSEIGTFGNDSTGIILTLPIWRNGKATSVLGCEYPIEVINQLFYADIFEGKGSVNIAKADGSVITTHGGLEGRSNYFEALCLTELKQGRTVEEIYRDMEEGKSGIQVFTYQGVTRYVDYRSVGFNDWYQITLVPESVVSSQLQQLSGMGFLLLAKILTVLLVLLFYLLHLQGKYTRELRQGNLDLYPQFVPNEAAPVSTGKQKRLYTLIKSLYRLAFDESLLFVPALHGDDAYPNRFHKSSYGKPELQLNMKKFISCVNALLQTMFLARQNPDVKCNKRQKTILAKLGISDFNDLPPAWVWMSTRPDDSLTAFSHCLFKKNIPTPLIFMRNCLVRSHFAGWKAGCWKTVTGDTISMMPPQAIASCL